MTIVNAGENIEKPKLSTQLVRMWNGIATLENHLALSYRNTHGTTVKTQRLYLSQKIENFYLQKSLCMNIHSTLSVIAKIWKQLKCASGGEWLTYETFIPWNATQQRKVMNYWYTHSSLAGSEGHYAEWKRANFQKSKLHVSIYITFLNAIITVMENRCVVIRG